MDIREIREDIHYQKSGFLEDGDLIPRDILEEKEKKIIDSKEIIVISGVRRCGKSSLMKIIAQKLIREREVNEKNIGYVNFEDPKLLELSITDCDKLYQLFLEEADPKNKLYLFLDEVQELSGWERWLNKLYEFEKIKIFVTGSNSSILKSETSSLLTGRNRVINLYPFSFKEFLLMKNITPQNTKKLLPAEKSKIRKAFEKYLLFGGLPEALKHEDTDILKSYYSDIIYRDILGRNLTRKKREIMEFSAYLASNPGRIVSTKKMQKMLGIKSHITVKNYLDILESAYLFFKCPLFDYSIKRQIYNPPKAYMIDSAMSKAVAFHHSPNYGWAYENIVYVELLRRGNTPFYWKSARGKEVDFVVKEGTKIADAIQVCFSIADSQIKEREINALTEARKEIKANHLLIITDDNQSIERIGNCTISIVPLWKWLIERRPHP